MTAGPALHLRGTVLPEGERRDVWVQDGRVVPGPVPGAVDVPGGWITPGLVDLHCHVGLDAGGAVDRDTAQTQALTDRDTGVLLIRDAGSPADTRWVDDRADLPRIVRAGRHIARTRRYLRNFAWEVEPEQLLAQVEHEAAVGDGWIKLVGDWIDRDRGDLGPCWPRWALEAAIGRAHELGARVTAHVFSEEPLHDLFAAGIDGIEHGTGLTDDLIATMAERGMSLVPTLINIANFPTYAAQGEAKFPTYARHMHALHERRHHVTRTAHEAGVTVLAGTDAGGVMEHGLIAQEVAALAAAGLPGHDALGAASWTARRYLLGAPESSSARLVEGAPADLVVYDADPRAQPEVLRQPRHVVLRGVVVA